MAMANNDIELSGTDRRKGRGARSKSQTNSRNNSRTNSPLTIPTVPEDTWCCQKCSQEFGDPNDKMLECQRCKDHFCINCLKKTEEEYNWMTKSDTMWFCIPCREKVERNIVVDREIEERCRDMAAKFESRIENLEIEMKAKCSKDDVHSMITEELKRHQEVAPQHTENQPSEESLASVISEINERKSREGNLILYGVSEKESDDKDERIKHDREMVTEIGKICEAGVTEGDITKITRLGKFDKEKENPSRPILVTFKDPKKKISFFKRGNNLKTNTKFSKTRVSNDLTKKEREEDKKLYLEAKEKEEQSGEFTYKVRGPPWGRRIVRQRKM